MYHGERNTDFEHPGWGGMFYEKADNGRLHGKFNPRFYKSDGSFIESCLKKKEIIVGDASLAEKWLAKPCQERCRLDANKM